MGELSDAQDFAKTKGVVNMHDVRVNVAARVNTVDNTIGPDILDSSQTHDNLIKALDIVTAPVAKGGKNYKVLITALHRDHGDDSNLGPHGHAHGWSVDIGEINGAGIANSHTIRQFVTDLLNNPHVTKVGGPTYIANNQSFIDLANKNGKTVFEDIGSGPHVHIQSDETH